MALASPVFALLDDACAPAQALVSRLCTGWLGEHRCDDPAHLDTVWAAAAVDLAQGLHLVLLADYEWGVRLAGLQGLPGVLRLLRFRHCERLTRAGVDAWLAQQEGMTTPGPAGVIGLTPDDDAAASPPPSPRSTPASARASPTRSTTPSACVADRSARRWRCTAGCGRTSPCRSGR